MRLSSCKRSVNRLYSVGELCVEEDVAEAVELDAVVEWNSSSKGSRCGLAIGGGLRMLELKSVFIVRSADVKWYVRPGIFKCKAPSLKTKMLDLAAR